VHHSDAEVLEFEMHMQERHAWLDISTLMLLQVLELRRYWC